jgi:hypothetical protein
MERGILTSHYQYKIGVLILFSIKCYSFSLSSEEECGERFARGVKIIGRTHVKRSRLITLPKFSLSNSYLWVNPQ